MPIYEYQCSNCNHQFDLIQKMSDPVQTHCPECNQDSATRWVSAPGFQLKGTGWYATDFKDKGKPEKKEPNSAAKPAQTNTSKPVSAPPKGDSA